MSLSRQIPVLASHYRRKGVRLSLATAVAAVLASQSAFAADLTWDDSGSSNIWDTTVANWGGAIWNNSTPGIAIFGGTGTNKTVAINAPIIATGLKFDSNGYTIGGTNILTLSGSTPTITVSNLGDSASISAEIAGTAGFTKVGAGTLTLSGANSYTGTTTVSAGTLLATTTTALPGYNALGNVIVNSGATLAVSVGGAGQWASADIDTLRSNVTFSSNTAVLGLNTAGGDFTYGSSISGALALRKLGANTLTLSGANSYTGATIISVGVLSVDTLANGGVNSSIGASSNASSNLSLGGGTLRYTGGTVTTDRAFALTASSTIDVANASTILTFASSIAGNPNSNNPIFTKTGSGTLVLAGSSDNGGLVLAVTSGEVDLAKGTGNGFRAVAGINSVAAGATVKLTGAGTDQIYDGSNGTNRGVNGLAGTLDLNGHSETTSNFGGASTGVVTNSAASTNVIWTVGGTNATSSFAGKIEDGNGTIALTKIGTGTQTLTGNNTYTGTTTIDAGTLQIGNAGTTGTLGSGAVINNGALVFKRNDAGTVTVAVSNVISGSGTLTQAGTNTLTLDGALANTYTGKTIVSSGILKLNKSVGVNAIAGDIDLTGGSLTWGQAEQIADTAKITLTGTGTIATVMTETVGDVSVTGAGVKFNPGSGSNLTVNSLTFTNITIAAPINNLSFAANSGDSTLTIGSGGWTVNNSNYSIGQGVGNGGKIPTVKLKGNFTGTGNNTIWAGIDLTKAIDNKANIDLDGGTRSFDIQSGTTTIVPKITNGSLTKVGAGTLTLVGAVNDYTGATIVSAGALNVSGSIAGSSQITVQNSGSLVLAGTSADRIGNTASLSLGSTGAGSPATLQLDNSVGQITETVGALTLANNSILDLGTGSAGSIFRFADSSLQSWTPGSTLSIYNWTSGTDHLFFGNGTTGLLEGQLNSITFYAGGVGSQSLGSAMFVSGGELAPVPEPTTLASGLVMLGYVFFHRRRAGRWPDMGRRNS